MNICPACAAAYSEVRTRFAFQTSRLMIRCAKREHCAIHHAAWHRRVERRGDDGWSILRDATGAPRKMVWFPQPVRAVGKTQWVSGKPIEAKP